MRTTRRAPGTHALRLTMLLALLPALATCLDSGTTMCADGLRCPPGTSCTADGAGCTIATCGNGIIDMGDSGEATEVCDDGNVIDGDGCRGDCQSLEICGDSITDAHLGEECDRGEENSNQGGLCSADCRRRCTGESLDEGEQCDDPLFRVSCLDFGYQRGRIGCRDCEPVLEFCQMIGWVRASKPVGVGDFHDVWGTDGTIVAVGQDQSGSQSAVARHDGDRWSLMATPRTAGVLRGVWASSPADLFVVGDGGHALRFDGTTWTSLRTGSERTLHDVWGSGPAGDLWAVGEGATVLRMRRQDGTWAAEALPDELPAATVLHGVWGSSPDHVFAVGAGGTILHRGQGGWQQQAAGLTTADLRAVWGSTPDDVFAVGAGGTILHYDGNTWAPMVADTTQGLDAVYGNGAQDVVAVGTGGTILFYDGAAWTALEPGTDLDLAGVWSAGGGAYVAVGRNGMILQHAGQSWTTRKLRPSEQPISQLWARASNEVYALTESAPYLLFFDGQRWRPLAELAPELPALLPASPTGASPVRDIWGNVRGDIYAVGIGSTILHRGPEGVWVRMPLDEDIPARTLNAVWGTRDGYLFAVGDGIPGEDDALILRYDGRTWTRMAAGTDSHLRDVWGNFASDVLAVGDGGVILQNAGEDWWRVSLSDELDETLHGVWGSDEGEVYVVGGGGTIARRIAGIWSESLTGNPTPWRSIWGSSRTDIYAVGFDGTILHFGDGAWSPVRSDTDQRLLSVWGVRNLAGTAQTVLFAGEGGTFLRLVESTVPVTY